MVNGAGPVWIERAGRLERAPSSTSTAARSTSLVERIVGPLGLRADRTSPVVDARLPDGSRVNVVVPPLAVDGPCITIRRFGARAIALADLCPPGVAELLALGRAGPRQHRRQRRHGRRQDHRCSTPWRAVLPADERIVTVEDAAELRLPRDHVVRLEARPATADGVGAVAIRDLVRNALRMRPDRIVVGEVRGAEALDMLWAMNTGHEGSLSTCHANSPVDALRRLEMMVLSAGARPAARRGAGPAGLGPRPRRAGRPAAPTVAPGGGGRRGRRPAPAGDRVRSLGGPAGLHDLPVSDPRPGAPAPDAAWCR